MGNASQGVLENLQERPFQFPIQKVVVLYRGHTSQPHANILESQMALAIYVLATVLAPPNFPF